jgi:epoxyqueuosine reductase
VTSSPAERSARVKQHAREVGFDLVGIAPPEADVAWERYVAQLEAGYGAEMAWLSDNAPLRRDARAVWPDARAVIALGVSYASGDPGYLAAPPGPDRGWIARYAQGRDYHLYVKRLLIALAERLAADPELGGPSTAHRLFVDTGPVLEKAFAQAAGIGWIGKNSLLVHPGRRGEPGGRGSWYFLAVVLTPLELAFDAPATDHCGTCRRCLDVCPTDAFPSPYVLDARRCIATWTIESPEPERVADAATLGQHVFGCDLCQEVCPWNRRPEPSRHAPLLPRPENVRPTLASLAALDEAGFRLRFPKSAVRRVKVRQMKSVLKVIRDGAVQQSGGDGGPDGGS